MAKKLSDITRAKIKGSRLEFYNYLIETENKLVMNSILELSEKTRVFIFSGVIRNFFLGENNNRDIDIVLEKEINIFSIFYDAEIKQNSFGGFKIISNNTVIDLWYLENTWAFKNMPLPTLSFNLERMIPGTAFFNFSSIVYSFNDKVFYFNDEFVNFLIDQEIDVVYEKNPNYKLCVVNAFYYSRKYKLNIKDNLKKYIIKLYNSHDKDYTEVQMKHFGKVEFSNKQIQHLVETIFMPRKRYEKREIIYKCNIGDNTTSIKTDDSEVDY